MIPDRLYVDDVITRALREDLNYIDVSTQYLIAPEHESDAVLLAKQAGVLCGLDIFLRVFELTDNCFSAQKFYSDGDELNPGDVIARVHGKTVELLKDERTALNLIQHMSGIATQTAACVKELEGTSAVIADTRKTLPGLRALQKYAVTCGGGKNHRFNLSDAAMLKDNHIDAYGGIAAAVAALRKKTGHTVKIEVETRNLDEVQQALDAGADIIMLDNMSTEDMKQAVKLVCGRVPVEASGNLSAGGLRRVALTGVNIISSGALTHSVKALDISLKIVKR